MCWWTILSDNKCLGQRDSDCNMQEVKVGDIKKHPWRWSLKRQNTLVLNCSFHLSEILITKGYRCQTQMTDETFEKRRENKNKPLHYCSEKVRPRNQALPQQWMVRWRMIGQDLRVSLLLHPPKPQAWARKMWQTAQSSLPLMHQSLALRETHGAPKWDPEESSTKESLTMKWAGFLPSVGFPWASLSQKLPRASTLKAVHVLCWAV
jgi:hypothetical protein